MSITITKNELFETAYTAVLKIQKTGSGFDVAAATYGGTLRYQIDQPIEVLETGNLPLVIGFTGVKVSTVDQINKVKVLKDQYPVIIDHQFQTVGKITEKSCQALIDQDWVNLGKLANINQGINQSLDISSPALDKAILAARDAGAYGAKLSGAGGGDCMFAISDNSKAIYIEEALKVAGTQVLHFKTNCEGVRLEKDLSE